MINLATGRDIDEEEFDEENDVIDETAFFAPAFYETWFDIQNGYYTDEDTGEQIPLREVWLSGGRGCVDGDTIISTPSGSHTHTITDNGHSHTTLNHRHAVPFSDYQVQENKTQGVRETDITPDGSYSSNSPAYTTSTQVIVNPTATGITINASNHTHPASSFSGNIGKTSGVLGDNDQVTSGNNPPYIVLNKIIKVM